MRPTPPEAMTSTGVAPSTSARPTRSRPFERAVAGDVGDHERVDAGIGERPSDVEHAAPAADEPAVGGHLARLRVEAHGHTMVDGQ